MTTTSSATFQPVTADALRVVTGGRNAACDAAIAAHNAQLGVTNQVLYRLADRPDTGWFGQFRDVNRYVQATSALARARAASAAACEK